ncbi:MAG TPA: tRNA epoxyqueuosine(34) reductase QueG [Dongiaceae bacterium]|nr:tRNA epoxyqueuosine(34) reductase QueG [Dongiaceae bacterium]
MKPAIVQRARELGFDDCRCTTATSPDHAARLHDWLAEKKHGEMLWLERNAEKRSEPQKVLPGAKSILTLAASYASEPPARDAAGPGQGMVARYARYADYHDVLAGQLKLLVEFINEQAPGTRSLWYVDTGPLLERDLAQRAGLGFVGKHTNLISRRLGNWFFLAEIITTLELPPDAPEANHCGHCTRCLTACPTAAITAPFELDARRCISYLTIELKGAIPEALRPAIGNRIYGCDDCLAVCPWNRFAREGRLMRPHARTDLGTPDLLELLALDEAGFKQRFAGTPIVRTKRRGLLRNVCVALGNTGDASVRPALERATHDPEPLIAAHAAWALTAIDRRLQRGTVPEHPGG